MNDKLHRSFDPVADDAITFIVKIDSLKIDAPFSTVQYAECWQRVIELRLALSAFADSVRSVRS